MDKIRVISLFSGYGSQELALKRLGIPHEIIARAEIDKYANTAYEALHGDVPNLGDVTLIDWSKVDDFDLLTYSFPCTDISSAGQQKGFDEDSGTRSGLLWECKRAIEAKRPKYLLMENVKALTESKFMPTFRKWQDYLSSLGYSNFAKVLNAKDFGVPQNRERVFMVSILGNEWYNFPKPMKLTKCLGDVLESEVDDKYFISQSGVDYILKRLNKYTQLDGDVCSCITAKGYNNWTGTYITNEVMQVGNLIEGAKFENPQRGRVYSPNGCSPTITTCGGGNLEPKILGYTRDSKGNVSSYHEKDLANTIHTSTGSGGNTDQFVVNDAYIRKLTPKECFRLQDVSDDDIAKIQSTGISNSQQYKMAGNSITVAVLVAIFEKMFIKSQVKETLFG